MNKEITLEQLFYRQLKLIANIYGIDLKNKYGYVAALRILFGKGEILN